MLSDKQIKELFFKLEKQEGIFDYKIGGIPLYFMLRFKLEMLLRASSNVNNQQQKLLSRIAGKIKRISKKKNSIQKENVNFDEVKTTNPSPYLFVGTCALKNDEGANIDMYDIIRYYHEKGNTINFIQPKYPTTPLPTKSKYYHSFLPLDITAKSPLSDKDYKTLTNFLSTVNKILNLDINSKITPYISYVAVVLNAASELKEYINKTKAKYVFARSIYTEPWILIACKNTNAKSIEIQHGVVNHHNVYYQSILNKNEAASNGLLMPDFILTLGNEWKKILIGQKSFFNDKNVFNLGSSHFITTEKSLNKNEGNLRLVFFLQGRGFNKLFSITNFIIQFIEQYKNEIKELNLELIVRPHPNDLEEVKLFITKYSKYINIENTIITNSIESIKKSDLIVSATSMCLYEALAYGKKPISFKQFKGMNTNNNHIEFIDSISELFDIIKDHQQEKKESISYLEPFNPKVLNFFIEESIG